MKKRYGQAIQLKPGSADKYIALHAAVWPDVLSVIKECHMENYSIFIHEDTLFAYFEYSGENYEEDMGKMAGDLVTQCWWSEVKPLMEPLESRKEGELWTNMEEIFHLE
jgi:L-rhamnose mutarotase